MDNANLKESDINKLHIDRNRVLSKDLCVLFETLAVHIFNSRSDFCTDEILADQIMKKVADKKNENDIQMIEKYIRLNDGMQIGICFNRIEYQEYYLSSWITRNLSSFIDENNNDEYFMCSFFEDNFAQYQISNLNLWCIQKFNKRTKEYGKDYKQFKGLIFRFINKLVENRYFYKNDGAFDKSKQTLFANTWGIVKSFYYCQNPISTENKHLFAKLLGDFFNSISDLTENYPPEINLAFMDFSETDLSNVTFYNTDFTSSNFYNSNLDDITIDGAKLVNGNFESAFMEVAGLYNCNCKGASFKGAHLLSSVIIGSDFTDADLRGVNLMECDIKDTCLSGIKIDNNTAINSTIFINADLSQINLAGLSISMEQMNYFLEKTKGLRDIEVRDEGLKILPDDKKQAALYRMLIGSTDSYLKENEFPENPVDIFISHATSEKSEIATPVYGALRDYGYSVWIDDYDVEENQLRRSIETGIYNCQAAVIIFSDAYKTRAWTKYELFRIIQESKKRKINVVIIAYNLVDIKDCPVGFKKLVVKDNIDDESIDQLINLLKSEEDDE